METNLSVNSDISSKIYSFRGIQVMLDSDLSKLYWIETKVFNQAVNRNIARFPSNFRFQLTKDEYDFLRSQFVTLEIETGKWKHKKYLPYVFTEQWISMLSAILKSQTAIEISIKIINSFVNMRKFLSVNWELFARLDSIEKKQVFYEIKTDQKIEKILDELKDKSIKPKQWIFFDWQVFDAYVFVSKLIKNANKSIILIDNYVDETVLLLLSKRNDNCKAIIYTKEISKQLVLDLNKYNTQYKNKIEIKVFDLCHDRFLILDEKEIYHIWASLKDIGKKRFAFSKFENNSLELLNRISKI